MIDKLGAIQSAFRALGIGCGLVWLLTMLDTIAFGAVPVPELARYMVALLAASGVLSLERRRLTQRAQNKIR